MTFSNGVYNNLRQKLDILGYTQTLPLQAIPLVATLFDDLVRTTESLRDAKVQIGTLLEEKTCWELGVEPYKCDNSRLLAECNELHLQLLKHKEEHELSNSDLNLRLRQIQRDKTRLEERCQDLQQKLSKFNEQSNKLLTHKVGSVVKSKDMSKKPFISTVRSGEKITKTFGESGKNTRCSKCDLGAAGDAKTIAITTQKSELFKLEQQLKDLKDENDFHKRKIEVREREIRRLNDLLSGGRSNAALAKDCCYKDVGKLSEDVAALQREKSELYAKVQDYEDKMHEAMQRAVSLERQNKQLLRELDELKEAALDVEKQANKELAEREMEIERLKKRLQQLRNELATIEKPQKHNAKSETNLQASLHKLYVEECEKVGTLRKETEAQCKKIIKLQHKNHHLQKELKDKECRSSANLDEEKIRLKSERDFFQREYLRLISKSGSDKEIEFLQSQIKSKDDELRILRSELCVRQQESLTKHNNAVANAGTSITPSLPTSARSLGTQRSGNSSNDCVQAIVLRAERERDCVRAELERVRCERDVLREKHVSLTQLQAATCEQQQQQLNMANERIRQLENEMHEAISARRPSEAQISLLKEQTDDLKRRLSELQEENGKLRTSQNQLKILHEQTHRSLLDYQNRLLIADSHLQAAESRLKTLDTGRESTKQETTLLRNEVTALKKTYCDLENEKDRILAQLDAKTEHAYQVEFELKACQEKRNQLEQQVTELEQKLEKLETKTRERGAALSETSAESKSLRQQIAALKTSRDQAIAENGRLSNDLAESQAEISMLKKKLRQSELEIERLKEQLRRYVEEVKKAEDLLLQKEKEREEMLEHYRSLSHDAVMLEGSNQTLEVEAAEYKRQCSELETEIESLKKDVRYRNAIVQQLEDKLSAHEAQNKCLEQQLTTAADAQRLLQVDLNARKELCDKLDIERDKLNAELTELNQIKIKLESANEELRNELDTYTIDKKVSSDTLEELLSKTRRDLEEQIRVDSKLSQELVRLRKTNEDLLNELDNEKERRRQHESLAHEYQVQNQELRHNITDDRFREARNRERSPRCPANDTNTL